MQDENFRTLTALLEGKKFEGNDKILLEQIIDVSKKLDELIVNRIGLVDVEKLRQLLWIANTNFRLNRLAYQGALVGDIERFKVQAVEECHYHSRSDYFQNGCAK